MLSKIGSASIEIRTELLNAVCVDAVSEQYVKESENLFEKISFGKESSFATNLSFLKEFLLFSKQCVLNLLKLAQNFLIFIK